MQDVGARMEVGWRLNRIEQLKFDCEDEPAKKESVRRPDASYSMMGRI
jgi:hypothetical protein